MDNWHVRLPLFIAALAALFGGVMKGEEALTFEKNIRPLLKSHCFHCHGEESKLKGGLDLRLVALIRQGAKSGPVLESAKEKSRLYEVLTAGEMPPEGKAMPAEHVALIGRWIDQGAPLARPEPQPLPQPGEYFITTDDRAHWAFQPIDRPSLPEGPEPNPVDRFLGAKLREKGLAFAPEADRATLIRRVSFDLTGLPPAPEDVSAFVTDASPLAWENLVDRLLASPHYGERWGRHWLDAAGYADSEGYDDKDVPRPDAWSYRDYVVRAFNEDKPWDAFITEQLAGDELASVKMANAQGKATADPVTLEKLTATGYLRMAPDGTATAASDEAELARQKVVTETVKIVSSSLLGLTLGCAECHDHRFDPLPQEDFYRLRAVFEPALNPAAWRQPNARRLAILSPDETKTSDAIEAEAKKVDALHLAEMNRVVGVILDREIGKLPEALRGKARQIYGKPAAQRTPEEAKFIDAEYPAVNVQRGTLHLFLSKYEDGDKLKQLYEGYLKGATEIRARKPQPDLVRVLAEDGGKAAPETRLFHRGDHTAPEGEPIEPGPLLLFEKLGFPEKETDLPSTGRRLALARHLTSGRHPLVARVLVNRFWMQHFGKGLAPDPGDFGLRSAAPTHPDLLDWLAADFTQNGWTLKRLHRLLLTSQAYRQSSRRHPEGDAIDAGNTLLWRMPVRRLEAETVRDAVLAVTGSLRPEIAGPPVLVAANDDGVSEAGGGKVSTDAPEFRRALYIQSVRTKPDIMLETFDAPRMEPNCERRASSTVAPQSLALMNSGFILDQSARFACDLLVETGTPDPAVNARRAWERVHGTAPLPRELADITAYLTEQTAHFAATPGSKGAPPAPERALATLCQVLLQTNRFLYVE